MNQFPRQNGRASSNFPRPMQRPTAQSTPSRGTPYSASSQGQRNPNPSNFGQRNQSGQRSGPSGTFQYQQGMSRNANPSQVYSNIMSRFGGGGSVPSRTVSAPTYKEYAIPYVPLAVRQQQEAEMREFEAQANEQAQRFEQQQSFPQPEMRQSRNANNLARFQRPYVKQTPAVQRAPPVQMEDECDDGQLEDVPVEEAY